MAQMETQAQLGDMGAERTTGADVWRKLRRNQFALLGAIMLLFMVAIALLADVIAPYDPYEMHTDQHGRFVRWQDPSSRHWLGTDAVGRDVISRLIHGARVSLGVGVGATGIAICIGVLIGATAGYFGGWVDNVLMRITDTVICFPVFFLVITLATLLRPNVFNVIAIIGVVYWTRTSRMVRGEFLKLRELDFIEAARALGVPTMRTIWRHLLPNAVSPIVVSATLMIAQAILTEASLSFLGVGVQQPMASWGNMLEEATSVTVLRTKPWLWIPPGVAILVTVLSINFLGDGLRDAIDPKLDR